MMPSPFRYPGGKSRAAARRWVLAHRPLDCREYREPLVGGGGVFWGLHRAACRERWVNDAHPGLVAVYLALRDRPAEFAAACRAVPPARLREEFGRLKADPGADPAVRYFLLNRTGFAGRVNYDLPSRLFFSNPQGWGVVAGDLLERAAAHLSGVRVTCGDYAPLLSEPGHPGGVWCYCDPPYFANTRLQRSSQLYQYGFSDADHERFAAAVRASPHKVAVSYDDCDLARDLFPGSAGFRYARASWAYSGTTLKRKARGGELLILNYEPRRPGVALED